MRIVSAISALSGLTSAANLAALADDAAPAYQKYYRSTDLGIINSNHWQRFLKNVEVATDKAPVASPTPSSDDDIPNDNNGTERNAVSCESPFGVDERDRLVSCYGEQSITTATFDSDVQFASSLLSSVQGLSVAAADAVDAAELNDISALRNRQKQANQSINQLTPKPPASTAFEFHVHNVFQNEGSSVCTDGNEDELCSIVQCIGTSAGKVSDFIESSLSDPDVVHEHHMKNLCSACMENTTSNGSSSSSFGDVYGGVHGNAHMQLYCTDASTSTSTMLLTAGGGQDGQAGPRDSAGSGGGVGMQVQLQSDTYESFSACNGGGCGLGTHMAGELTHADHGEVVPDSYCDLGTFATALGLIKEEIQQCILNPDAEISVASGGSSDGKITNMASNELIFQYSTNFRFTIGPDVLW